MQTMIIEHALTLTRSGLPGAPLRVAQPGPDCVDGQFMVRSQDAVGVRGFACSVEALQA